MPAPPGAGRGDLVEQLDVGEPDRVADSPPAHDHVGRAQRHDREQAEEAPRLEEGVGHDGHQRDLETADSRARRRRTWRTRSESQSESVLSRRCSTPADSRPAAIASLCSRAASA